MILPDSETKVDLLNNEAIAETITSLLRERCDYPLTIGIHGDWGAGKSSILEMIDARLGSYTDALCLRFNGWRFQGFEDAKIALIEGIVSGLLSKRTALTKTEDAVKDVLNRIDWLKIAKKAGGFAWTAFTGLPNLEQIGSVLDKLSGIVNDPAAHKETIETTVKQASGLLKPASDSKSVPEEVAEFQKAFKKLLEKAEVKQLVVLIDDLDRCLPETAIDTLEAVRLFLFTERTAFVVAADEAMVEYAVRRHFPDLVENTSSQSYARKYLEKLIQIPFRIPALGETETRIYVTLLLIGADIGESDEGYSNLIAVAREKLKRPWGNGLLDLNSIKEALGDKASSAQSALALSDQIGPILASGTMGNPRQIKRFLNTLHLRYRTAEARGFADDVNLPALAKLMLAERFLSSIFDQIAEVAASNPDGKCADLALLEEYVITSGGNPVEKPVDGDSLRLIEWKKARAVCEWANLQPYLGDVDLRPYLFLSKDRKDYFGSASALGHLAMVAEQLMGPKFAVQPLETSLRRLVSVEVSQVFELIRAKIVGAGQYTIEPAGVQGLSVLIKAHPELRPNLLDFLESLPCKGLGVWVCSGWGDMSGDEKRYRTLLEKWSTEGDPILQAAAKTILDLQKGVK